MLPEKWEVLNKMLVLLFYFLIQELAIPSH
jgi:hypothetical protein